MIESTVKNIFTEWSWCSPAGRSVCTQSVWKMRRILKQTINASNLKASLWSITLAPDPGVLSLLQHHWQQRVNNLHSFTQDMALRFGNVCICQNTQSKGKKWSVRKKNNKNRRKLICLAELHWIPSWIQRSSIPLIFKYIKQVITIGTASKLETALKMQKVWEENRHDNTRAREQGKAVGRNQKKNHKYLPSFTPDHCSTAENWTQTSELPAQDLKYIRFPLREMTAPNKAL